jgi:hypothetical protein
LPLRKDIKTVQYRHAALKMLMGFKIALIERKRQPTIDRTTQSPWKNGVSRRDFYVLLRIFDRGRTDR